MAWNSDATRFKSTQLTNLDCGNYLKIPQGEGVKRLFAVYDGDLEVGQCVAMVRVPANAYVVGARIAWAPGTQDVVFGVGDPYACGRFLSVNAQGASAAATTSLTCTVMTKVGRIGDGCGIGYQYTCETDIFLTNLYREGMASVGGWAGGSAASGTTILGAKWTGGRIALVVDILVP